MNASGRCVVSVSIRKGTRNLTTMFKTLLSAAVLLLFIACHDEGGGQGAAVPASSSNNAPVENTTTTAPTTSTAQPGNTAGGVALNPPHGEPGHICEIPVGQPLDGSGGTTGMNENVITVDPARDAGTSTIITPNAGNSASSGQSGTINPPHGEPGHVCEVPVGQPIP